MMPVKLKVCIFSSLYTPNEIGGAEKSTRLLAEGLLREGYEPIVITTSDHDYSERINGVLVYYLRNENLYWGIRAKSMAKWKKGLWHIIDAYNYLILNKIEMIINRERPCIVHTNGLSGFSVAIWRLVKKKRIKIVHTLRDHYLLCPETNMFRNGNNCVRQCRLCKMLSVPKKYCSAYVDAVVGISKYILDKHLDYGYFKNVLVKDVIFNSIKINSNGEVNQSVRQNPPGNIVIGYVGTLSPHKGVEDVLDVVVASNDLRLYLYGSGITDEYKDYLVRKYSGERIRFFDYSTHDNIYKALDWLVVPSHCNECFSRVIPEAYSYGIPVIASNIGGIPEIVDEGKTGFLFSAGNKVELSGILQKVVRDKGFMHAFKVNSFRKAQDFIIYKQVAQYVNIYSKLVN